MKEFGKRNPLGLSFPNYWLFKHGLFNKYDKSQISCYSINNVVVHQK